MNKKWICTVCGYVYEGPTPPEKCPQCKAPASKFQEQAGEMTWAAEHIVGVAQGVPEDILADLRSNFNGECSEVPRHEPRCVPRGLPRDRSLLGKGSI